MLNPYTCEIVGDLSRADVVALTLLCRDRDVVEFGIGGSTVILSQVANSLVTYETKPEWVERTQPFLDEVPKSCNPDIRIIKEDKDAMNGKGFDCDVLFVDGWSLLRWPFVREFWPFIRDCAVLHDSRVTYAPNVVREFLEHYRQPDKAKGEIWAVNELSATLKDIHWNYLESNMAVMTKRSKPLYWEDWKKTEAHNNRRGYGRA